MSELPSGTVTLLFTDIEGSTRLLRELGERYASVLQDHRRLLRSSFELHGGREVDTQGDAFFVAFARTSDALAAVTAAQRALIQHTWPDGAVVRVRMGIHVGQPLLTDSGYVGMDVHRAARLAAVGHGGQVLLTDSARALVEPDLPSGIQLRDLGEHRMKGLPRPERIFQLIIPNLRADFPPLRTLDARPNNLPVMRDVLIGRERELAAAREILARRDVGLMSLVGPGGTGKTRLALQLAADLLDHFTDGVFFVDLTPISDPGLVTSAIAHALDIREDSRPLIETLRDALRNQVLLLLLDNFEQVLDSAPLVAELLRACPHLKVLVTSRAVLRVSGEYDFPVPPLEVPAPSAVLPFEQLSQCEAIRLFIERARAAQPHFRLTDENASAVAEICRSLDGLPLAIELAAARVRVLPPRVLSQRLREAQGDSPRMAGNRLPLNLLTGGPLDRPAHQQTLRGTIAWSYRLLRAREREGFRQLSVFVGGWSLDAAASVLGDDALELVTALVDISLVRRDDVDAEPRFSMLTTIREFALELFEADHDKSLVRERHATYYTARAEATGPAIYWVGGGNLSSGLLAPDHDNFRAVLDWSLASSLELGLRLVGALWRFWFVQGHLSEGSRRLADLSARLPAGGGPETLKTAAQRAYFGGGWLSLFQTDYPMAGKLWRQSLSLAREIGHQQGVIESLCGLGTVAQYEASFAAATQFLDEAVVQARQLGNPISLADALMYRGLASHRQENHAEARQFLEDSLTTRRRAGTDVGLGPSLSALAFLAMDQGDYNTARACLEERVELWRRLGDINSVAISISGLGLLALAEGDLATARRYIEDGFTIKLEAGVRGGMSWYVGTFALLALEEGQLEHAAHLGGAASELWRIFGPATAPSLHLRLEHMIQSVREATFKTHASAWERGRRLSIEQVIQYILAANRGSQVVQEGRWHQDMIRLGVVQSGRGALLR